MMESLEWGRGDSRSGLSVGAIAYALAKKAYEEQETKVIDDTLAASLHYMWGKGEAVELGPKTKETLKSNDTYEKLLNDLKAGRAKRSDHYGVDLTGNVYHIGHTTVHYDTVCAEGSCTTTFTGFTRKLTDDNSEASESFGPDGFWDIPPWADDATGPAGEVPGGTPYPYRPYTWTETYKSPYPEN